MPPVDDADGTRLRVVDARPDPVSLEGSDGERENGVELACQASQLDQESGRSEDNGAQSDHDGRLHFGDVGGGVADRGVELQAAPGLEVGNAVGYEHELEGFEALEVRDGFLVVPPRVSGKEVPDLWHVEHGVLDDAGRHLVKFFLSDSVKEIWKAVVQPPLFVEAGFDSRKNNEAAFFFRSFDVKDGLDGGHDEAQVLRRREGRQRLQNFDVLRVVVGQLLAAELGEQRHVHNAHLETLPLPDSGLIRRQLFQDAKKAPDVAKAVLKIKARLVSKQT